MSKADQVSALREINPVWRGGDRETGKMCNTLVTEVKRKKRIRKNAEAGLGDMDDKEDNVLQESGCDGWEGAEGDRRERGSGLLGGVWFTGRKHHVFGY